MNGNPIASPPWIDLPLDVTANVLHMLGAKEILVSAQFVCATWWRVCKDPSMWRVIDMFDPRPGNLDDSTVCFHAVDRSQGGLIDIRIGPFCTNSLLLYITERSSRLKRLTIASLDISGGDLIAALKKLGGELEELRLFYTPSITAQDIETIALCCPLLKTFAFNNPGLSNSRALAIAKNMPNLRHLELNANLFTEKGLQAILDGCPCLKSLDLRLATIYGLREGDGSCYFLLKEEDLQKRCSWIKNLRLSSNYS